MHAPVASTSTARRPSSSSTSGAPRRFPVGWDVPPASLPRQRRHGAEGPSSDVELSDSFVEATDVRRERKEERKPERKRRRADEKGKGRAKEERGRAFSADEPHGRPPELQEQPLPLPQDAPALPSPQRPSGSRGSHPPTTNAVVVNHPVAIYRPGPALSPAPRPRLSPSLVPLHAVPSPAHPTSALPSSDGASYLVQGTAPAARTSARVVPRARARPSAPPLAATARDALAIRHSPPSYSSSKSSQKDHPRVAALAQHAPHTLSPPVHAPALLSRASSISANSFARPRPPPSASPTFPSPVPSTCFSAAPALASARLGYSPAEIRTLYAPPRASVPPPVPHQPVPHQPVPHQPTAVPPPPAHNPAALLKRFEPKRGPASDDVLFGGADQVPQPAPPPAARAPPPRPHPQSPQRALVKRESPEQAARERAVAEAEERRRRAAWAAPLPEYAPPITEPSKTKEELEQAELKALFSPPGSPAPSGPGSPRETSPELFAGVDVSPAKKARATQPSPPKRKPGRQTRSRSHTSVRHGPARDALDGEASENGSSADAHARKQEPTGSPELVMGLIVNKEVRGAKGTGKGEKHAKGDSQGKTRGVKGVVPAMQKKGKSSMQKKWVLEDSWWTRSLDKERGCARVPPGWTAAEQPGLREVADASRLGEQAIEVVIREVVLSLSDIFQAILEKGEWCADLTLALVATSGAGSVRICEYELRVRLLLEPPHPHDPAHRSFKLDYPRPFALGVDPKMLGRNAGAHALEVTLKDASVSLVARHALTASTPFEPFCGHLPFLATSDTSALSKTPSPSAPTARTPGISLLLTSRSLPRSAPPSPQSITAHLSARIERLSLDRDAPSGVWIPDAVAVRGEEVREERTMPALETGAERSGFDFLTKVPLAPGEPVRLFVEDTVKTTRALVRSQDEEISRSSMSPEEKLLARMQTRWCLLNPYPPTVYHRERACWVHFAPVLSHFRLRDTLVLHLVRHLLRHALVTQPQLREIVRAFDGEVARVERGEREGYEGWRRRAAWEEERLGRGAET